MTAANPPATLPSSHPAAHSRRVTLAVIASIYVVLATATLTGLALAVHQAPPLGLDLEISRTVQAYTAEWFRLFMVAMSWPGFPPQINVLVVLIFVLLYRAFSRWQAWSFALDTLLIGASQGLLKVLVDRPRPSPELIWVADPRLIGNGILNLGFPAGHPASAVATFGFLWYLAYCSLERSRWRTLFLTSLGAFFVLVGFSRIYEGGHWFSDVVGGYLLGSICLISTIYFYEWGKTRFLLREKHKSAHPSARPSFLARSPALGVGLLLLGSLLFGVLAVNVWTNGPLLAWDVPLSQTLHAQAAHDFRLVSVMMGFGGVLGREAVAEITVVLGLYWLWKRYWHEFSLLFIGVIGGSLWLLGLSGFFGRPRPIALDPLNAVAGPSFPSGSALTATLLYGLLLYLLLPHLSSWRWRLLATLGAGLSVLLIGFSALYLGASYLTDVLGGYAFGLAWGALVYTGVELYYKYRSAPPRRAPG